MLHRFPDARLSWPPSLLLALSLLCPLSFLFSLFYSTLSCALSWSRVDLPSVLLFSQPSFGVCASPRDGDTRRTVSSTRAARIRHDKWSAPSVSPTSPVSVGSCAFVEKAAAAPAEGEAVICQRPVRPPPPRASSSRTLGPARIPRLSLFLSPFRSPASGRGSISSAVCTRARRGTPAVERAPRVARSSLVASFPPALRASFFASVFRFKGVGG